MSERQPWHAEYELDAEQVRQVISRNTELIVSTVRFLGAGWDFYNWLINDEWVFRFPKRHSDIDTLVHEKRFLERVTLNVQVPRFDYWVERPIGFHKPFAGYACLPGTQLLEYSSDSVNLPALGKSIGETLTELHQQSLTALRVPVDPISLFYDEFDDMVDRVRAEFGPVEISQIQHALKAYRPRDRTGHQVSAHNDLGVEHLLVHDEANLAGVIDWADAATANGFVDFAGIWGWGGDPALRSVLSHYYVEPTHEDLGQIRIHGLCYGLEQVAYGRAIGNDELHRTAIRWVQQRIGDGELANVYAAL